MIVDIGATGNIRLAYWNILWRLPFGQSSSERVSRDHTLVDARTKVRGIIHGQRPNNKRRNRPMDYAAGSAARSARAYGH